MTLESSNVRIVEHRLDDSTAAELDAHARNGGSVLLFAQPDDQVAAEVAGAAFCEVLPRTEQPIAVLVNDVGSVNVDASLIRRTHGDTIELTDGCVCCSLAGGLAEAFDGLRARPVPPDHVILEMSGVADPARVAPWAGSDGFRLDGIVVLADTDQLDERLADPATGPAVRSQLAAADLFVLTKLDLTGDVGRTATTRLLDTIAPAVPILDAADAVATAAFLDLATRRPGGIADLPQPALFDAHEITTVPVPAARYISGASGGMRLPKPASPPPPVTWTCPSTSAGTTVRPCRSIVCPSDQEGRASTSGPTWAMRDPATTRSQTPVSAGAKRRALRMRESIGRDSRTSPKGSSLVAVAVRSPTSSSAPDADSRALDDRDLLVDDHAVEEVDGALCVFGPTRIVGDHADRRAALVQFGHQVHNR